MATVVLTVPGISCEHCVRTVTETLTPIEGVQQIAVDLPAKQVEVRFDEDRVDIERMSEALAEEEYPVAAVSSVER